MLGSTPLTPPRQGPPQADDETVDLAPYLRELIRRWHLVLALVLAGAVLGFLSTRLSAPQFEAVSTLMVMRPKIASQPVAGLDTANFRALVENHAILADAIKTLNLEDGPEVFTPRVLLQRYVRVEEVTRTNLLRVRVRMRDPQTAAAIANALADGAVRLNQRISQAEGVESQGRLLDGRKEAQKRFDAAEATLVEARNKFQLELRRKDVESMLAERLGLLPLQAEIAAERAKLAAAEVELKARQPIVTLRRSLDGDPALMEAVRGARPGAGDLLRLETSVETNNRVYEEIDTVVATSRARLAALERRRRELVEVSGIGASSMKRLNDLYTAEATLARLETEYAIAKMAYEDVSKRSEQARIDIASFSSQLQIVDVAQIPDRAEPRGGAQAVLAGAMLGLVLGCAVAFGRVLRRRLDV